jgi:hypothetical protein
MVLDIDGLNIPISRTHTLVADVHRKSQIDRRKEAGFIGDGDVRRRDAPWGRGGSMPDCQRRCRETTPVAAGNMYACQGARQSPSPRRECVLKFILVLPARLETVF